MSPRLKRGTEEPETRVGICCGDRCKLKEKNTGRWSYALLFKVPGMFRYRCGACFQIETGRAHHLDSADLVPMCRVCGEPHPSHTLACPMGG